MARSEPTYRLSQLLRGGARAGWGQCDAIKKGCSTRPEGSALTNLLVAVHVQEEVGEGCAEVAAIEIHVPVLTEPKDGQSESTGGRAGRCLVPQNSSSSSSSSSTCSRRGAVEGTGLGGGRRRARGMIAQPDLVCLGK